MKKLFYLWAALATTFALTNCQKEELINGGNGEDVSLAGKFVIQLSTPTKTANDGLSTIWVKGDKVNVFHAETGTDNYVNDGAFEFSSGNAFAGDLGKALESGKSYDWFIAYPYSETMTSPKAMSIHIPRAQTQATDDDKSHLCGALCPLYGKETGISGSSTPKLAMKHLVTVMKIKVTNYEATDCVLNTVAFSHHDRQPVKTALCGNYLVDLTADTQELVQNESSFGADISDWKENDAFTKAQVEDDYTSPYITLASAKTLKLNESATVYLVCKPFTIENATFLNIGMNTQSGGVSVRICDKVVPCKAGAINGVKQGSHLAPPLKDAAKFYYGVKKSDGSYEIIDENWWRCDLPKGYDLNGEFDFKKLFTTVNSDASFRLHDAQNQNPTVQYYYNDFTACLNGSKWNGTGLNPGLNLSFPGTDKSGVFLNVYAGYEVGEFNIWFRNPSSEPEEPVFDTESDMYDSYHGLIMAGYQGWHGTPGDGCAHNPNENWPHYSNVSHNPFLFEPGALRNGIDFWPDVSEYPQTYEATGFTTPDGSTPRLYSSYDASTVDLHFRWMQEYGIDGVFMQRFVSQIIDPIAIHHSDKVLESAMMSSNVYARAISVMYDMVGMDANTSADVILNDARELINKYNLMDRELGQRYYLYHNGKPLIGLVSVGQASASYTIAQAQEIVDGLQAMGFSVMLGVPAYWRNPGDGDCVNDNNITNLIKDVDIIMPWLVGVFDYDGTSGAAGGKFTDYWSSRMDDKKVLSYIISKGDYTTASEYGVEYCPLVFPGFSDRNIHPNNTVYKRHSGDFYWQQIYKHLNKGAQMLYVAMFDEIDEGTAIYKCLRQSEVPSNETDKNYYVVFENGAYRRSDTEVTVSGRNDWCKTPAELNITFNGIENELPSDYYLWLTGQAAKVLKGEATLTQTKPTR